MMIINLDSKVKTDGTPRQGAPVLVDTGRPKALRWLIAITAPTATDHWVSLDGKKFMLRINPGHKWGYLPS